MRPRISIKHISLTSVLVAVLAFLLFILFFFTGPAYSNAHESGRLLGEETGRKVGVYSGSLSGIKNGVEHSRTKEHTAEEIASKLSEITSSAGSLCILSESLPYNPELTEDDEVPGTTAVFTVDLAKAEVKITGDTSLLLIIPVPECHVYRNSDNSETVVSNDQIKENSRKEARQIALTRTEKIADMVCDSSFTCSVTYSDQKGGE